MTLTPAEAGVILHAASQADNRSFDETTAKAWAAMIDPGVTFEDALAAVGTHYTRTRQWLMPADINDLVRQVHRQRMQDAGPPDYPSGLTQSEERAWRELWLNAIKRGATAVEATVATDQTLRIERGQLVSPAVVVKAIEDFTKRRRAS